MLPQYIDTHCHLDLFRECAQVRARIEKKQILTIAVTNSPTVYRRNVDLAAGSANIIVAAGLHPELVFERESELPQLLELVDQTRFVGEVGLDYQSPDASIRARQR